MKRQTPASAPPVEEPPAPPAALDATDRALLALLQADARASTANLAPLNALIDAHVLAAERLHGDDTTVPVLARGKTIKYIFTTFSIPK